MAKRRVMVLGLGEVGHPLFQLLNDCGRFRVYGWDIDEKKMSTIKQGTFPQEVEVLHICYPCYDQDKFVKTTIDYVRQFTPKLVIINSTVSPGTTLKVYEGTKCNLSHSPVRGIHRKENTMKKDLLFWTKYIGGVNSESTDLTVKHFKEIGLKTKALRGPVETELAKLFETTYRAWMIAVFQEMHRISRHFGADFDQVVDMLADVHRVRLNKPPHYPGVIGGHCLIPNTKLLLKSYDSEFLQLILKSNEFRKKEIKDKGVLKEVEKIERRVRVLEEKLQRNLKLAQ